MVTRDKNTHACIRILATLGSQLSVNYRCRSNETVGLKCLSQISKAVVSGTIMQSQCEESGGGQREEVEGASG